MSTDEWIKKCGIYIPWTIPTLKKKEILPVHNNTMKLRDVMLNEISQSQKITIWLMAWFHLYKVSKIVKGFPCAPDDKESACNMGDLGSIPGLGRTPGEGNGYPLQYSCLENSMDRETWEAWCLHGWATSTFTDHLFQKPLQLAKKLQ